MSLEDGDFGYHDLERAALGFVLESEMWPVFLRWAEDNHASEESHKWLLSPDLGEARRLWMLHSPDELIRLAAGMVEP